MIPLKDISNLVELFYSHEEFKISFLEIAKFIKNNYNSKLLKNLYKEINKIIEILPDDVKLLLEAC